jgi:hypothetical protein
MFSPAPQEQRPKLSDSLLNSPPVVNRPVRTAPYRHFELGLGTKEEGEPIRGRYIGLSIDNLVPISFTRFGLPGKLSGLCFDGEVRLVGLLALQTSTLQSRNRPDSRTVSIRNGYALYS